MAAKTITKTRTIAEVVAEAEERVRTERIGPARRYLDETAPTLAVLTKQQEALADGDGKVAAIEQRWREGEDVPSQEYSAAVAADAAVPHLLAGLKTARLTRERNLPAESSVVARALAPTFLALTHGVPVIDTFAPRASWESDLPEGEVAIVLVQHAGAVLDPATGTYSGKVSAFFYRRPMYAAIGADRLEQVARANRIGARVGSYTPGDGTKGFRRSYGTSVEEGTKLPDSPLHPDSIICDEYVIAVSGAYDQFPEIAVVDLRGATEITLSWAYDFVTASLGEKPMVNGGGNGNWRLSADDLRDKARIWVSGKPATVADESVSEGMRVTRTVQEVTVRSIDMSGLVDTLKWNAKGAIGTLVPGVGVLDSFDIDVMPMTVKERSSLLGSSRIKVTTSYRSKVPAI